MMNRCRVMPISRIAVVAGLGIAYMVRSLLATIVLLAVAFLVFGFRFQGDVLDMLAYLLIVVIFTATAITGYSILAIKLRRPALVNSVAIIPYTPLLLLSNGFSPTENFPQWLQPFVRSQPVSITCDALRAMVSGSDNSLWLAGQSLLWLFGLLIVFGILALRAYKRMV